ncbi:hypothetical protein B0H10DRAFT_2210145 [Mycena sp. CBHHK59/15]|nr:hypothetical protein B0H10DRAFT_2210145 [Mycena sp. CBHHK59/15]
MSSLFTPLNVGNTTIKNRIGQRMSAMTRNRADSSAVPTHIMKKYYLQRALGGAGLIVTEATLISPQALWHVGRLSHLDAPQQIAAGEPVYAPSAIAARGGEGSFRFLPGAPGFVTPTEILDPSVLITQYKNAALNAKLAGFDGVELHAASGFLVHQFLDSTSNTRTDEWGGNVENRARFGVEVLKALVEVFGPDVSIKISPAGGLHDMGMPIQDTIDTFSYFIAEADKLKLSYITLNRYAAHRDPVIEGKKRGTPHGVLATYRKLIKHAKTFVVGGVTPAEANELAKTGQVDGVFFGALWLAHPDLAKRIQHSKAINNELDLPHLYGNLDVDPALGYTDYPAITY